MAFDFADVEAFLQCIGARLLIRGHDHVPEGFRRSQEYPHLVTLYSSTLEVAPGCLSKPKMALWQEKTGWDPRPEELWRP